MAAYLQEAGRSGYEAGWAMGYHYGRCQAVVAGSPLPVYPMRKLRVLYVPQGFPTIDAGIEEALRANVRELTVCSAADMLEAASALRPDLVLVLNALHHFPADHFAHLNTLRKLRIRTAVWFADDPYFTDLTVDIAPHYDYVFTHELNCVELYRRLGCARTYYLPLGFSPTLYRPVPTEMAYQSDICFIGVAFRNRVALFDAIAPYLKRKRVILAGAHWDRLASYDVLKPFIRDGWVPPEETVRYYSGAKIVINPHRTYEPGVDNKNSRGVQGLSINPRTYEMAACGALQLTDVRSDVFTLYSPGTDIDIYEDAQELMSKLDYYLHHEEERRSVALKGLKRTRLEHSYGSRIAAMLGIIFEEHPS